MPSLYNTNEDREDNVPIAFLLVTLAGLSTSFGAILPFFIKIKDMTYLAKGLAFSAGIMIYVSFIEIYSKSLESFEDHFIGEGDYADSHSHEVNPTHADENPDGTLEATGCAMASIFAGMLLVKTLDAIVHRFFHYEEADFAEVLSQMNNNSGNGFNESDGLIGSINNNGNSRAIEETEKLQKVGLITAIAIAIHNFPEGLATFVATLDDPGVGAALAFAIAIHNIPEGICVALPVYYSTGSKWRALFWATLAGVSEPLGAFFGWLVLNNNGFDDISFGIIFGICGGAMIMISFEQLIPNAFKHDIHNKFTTTFIILGFIIMALSLILFLP